MLSDSNPAIFLLIGRRLRQSAAETHSHTQRTELMKTKSDLMHFALILDGNGVFSSVAGVRERITCSGTRREN